MKAAAAQFFATPFARERNLQIAERLAREAAAAGARIVVLPGLFNTGYVYTPRLYQAAEDERGPTLAWLRSLSAELNVLLGGVCLLRTGRRVFDTFVLAEPNGRTHTRPQQRLFVWEHCYFDSGSAAGVVETGLGRVGLLAGWDAAVRNEWTALRDSADLVLVSSAPPRLHRAVLNFPEARKVYVADLLPGLLDHRDTIDDWFSGGLGLGAALAGAPVVSAMMAGRFVTEVPYPRLSFGLAAMGRPRYWAWAGQAHKASLRATFYGRSAVFDASGRALTPPAGEEAWVMADLGGAASARGAAAAGAGRYLFADVPGRLRLYDSIIRALSRLYRISHTQ